ncbi:MAG TPA: hypothetical protein VLZ33_06160 [Dysgonamonadaceae bacterium]|nr:hypothetical protein [Dysgonamonadaceae bacterium]
MIDSSQHYIDDKYGALETDVLIYLEEGYHDFQIEPSYRINLIPY